MQIKCPHCEKQIELAWPCTTNIENYGAGQFDIQCYKCKGMIKVYGQRKVVITLVKKSDSKYADWPYYNDHPSKW